MTDTLIRVERRSADPIRRASRQALRAEERTRQQRARDVARRRALRLIDTLLPPLEEINLSGRGADTAVLSQASLDQIGDAVGQALPDYVRDASTPVTLHAALLDWQEELLDVAAPQRSDYREVDLEIDPPVRRRRRRAAGQPLREAA